ncbi:5-oxoprolinase subunit PxpB [Cecembia sp.]|uniref:5-oxoprolinase subunit PxpB n=1 Tax=Cecembia sp. TaxID=1898110 RepID=UPI0025C52A10|nr:5-oxoprolinase subunit PxpB [Cecembia sp.]
MDIRYFRTHEKLVEFTWPPIISEEILMELKQVASYLNEFYGEGIKEIRKGYNSLSLRLHVDISDLDCQELIAEFKNLPLNKGQVKSKTWHFPVFYGGTDGKDLVKLSKIHRMEPEEIIQLHSAPSYFLHFYGFLPGFMYLGGLDPKLFTPRKEQPERIIKGGSVAIGGHQTGIYPQDSPGGWYAIGKCPVHIFDIKTDPPVQAQVGDYIRFLEVDKQTFDEIHHLSALGKYKLNYD